MNLSDLFISIEELREQQIPEHPLSGNFTDYLTDLEGSKCDILDEYDWNLMPFKWRGVDLDQFKQECGEIDNE